MCNLRLICAASDGLSSAIAFTRSKNAGRKMCWKMSSLRLEFMRPRRAVLFLRGILRARIEPVDEAGHRLEHRPGLVAVRRMAAVRQAQQLDRTARLLRDRLELRHRPVLVVEAL